MPLSQAEADYLLSLAKEFTESDPLIFPNTQPLNYNRPLRSVDRREEFFLTVERGNRNRARLKYQTRGRSAECETLIREYLRWLKEGLRVNELESSCQIATPFLDRHNDEIEIYVQRSNGGILLTDDGYTIADLESTGMSFNTPHRQAHLTSILNGFGVRQKEGELQLTATERDFPQKKHSLVQAILAVNDMFVTATAHVYSLFKEDVAAFLEQRNIPVFPEFKMAGKSGFDHRFDFGLPKTATRPQRVLQAINNLTKDQALSFAFAVADVKAVRADPLDAYTFVNDVEHPPGSETMAALRAYDIEPLYWSRRQENYQILNGANGG